MRLELKAFLERVADGPDVHPLVRDALCDSDVESAAEVVGTLLRTWNDAVLVPSSVMLPILE